MRPLLPLVLATLLSVAACAATPPARDAAASSCANGTDSDGNLCEPRQTAAVAASAPITTPPALEALLAPRDDAGPADRVYREAWSFEKANDFARARAAYGDLLTDFPASPRAAFARFQMGEMYLAEGLAFGAYLDVAARTYEEVAGDTSAEPALVAFALMRLEQTAERLGDGGRAAASKARLAKEFPASDAAKALPVDAKP